MSDWPDTVFGDNALYFEVRIYVDQANCAGAQTVYQRLATDYPGTTAVTSAQTYLAGGGC